MTQIAGNNSLQSGLQGYQNASQTIQEAGAELAKGQGRNSDLNAVAVSLTEASIQASASAEVISRSNDTVGSIIDIFV